MPPGIGYRPGAFQKLLERAKAQNPRAAISSRFMQQANRDETAGREAEDVATRRLTEFDADRGAERSARAQFDTFREDLGRDVESLRGSQVGRGRLNSGFGFEDEDRLVEGGIRDLTRTLAQNALQAQSLNLQAAGGLANVGAQRSGRFLDILGSERDASFLEDEMARRKKAEKRSGLFGALGTIAKGVGGYLAGGPAGAGLALST